MRVGVLDYGDAFVAAGYDGRFRGGGLGDFVLEEVGRCEGVVAFDWKESGLDGVELMGEVLMYSASLPKTLSARRFCSL